MKSPAFQFYPGDFLSGEAATFDLEEIGLYLVLLAFDWNLNGLPSEPEKLAKLARVSVRKFTALWETVGQKFVLVDGRYYNPRLQLEREKQETNREKKVNAAHSRWNADADAGALQAECSSSSVSSSEQVDREAPARVPYPADFVAVWDAYPRRAGGNSKRDAFRVYTARRNAGVPPDELLAGVERYAAYIRATGREGSEFVKQAATFLGPNEHWREPWEPPTIGVRDSRPAAVSDGAEAAWDAVVAMLPAWQRREITAEVHAGLPAATRRGLSTIGGFAVIQNTPTDKRTWLKRDFVAAYRAPAPPQRQTA